MGRGTCPATLNGGRILEVPPIAAIPTTTDGGLMTEDATVDLPADDTEQAWIYALNAHLGPDPDALDDPVARRRAERARDDRVGRYAGFLASDLDADVDRLTAAASACRAIGGNHERAADLADLALELVVAAGADSDPAARARLLAELNPTPSGPEPDQQGLWHRHRLPRRLLRRLDPRWWYRRAESAARVRLAPSPADGHAGYHRIEMLRGGFAVGELSYRLCAQCEVGFVAKISIQPEDQGRGLGSRALQLARLHAPGYRWTTSGQALEAKTFWQMTARRTRRGYRVSSDPDSSVPRCPHMK